jgi:hypothetical protein
MNARFIRVPEHDRRIRRGDDFAGDAWLDLATGEVIYVAVGYCPADYQYPARVPVGRSDVDHAPEKHPFPKG